MNDLGRMFDQIVKKNNKLIINMSKKTDIKVPIKDELRKQLIFGMESRLPIAMILGYAGYRHQVIPKM